MQLSRCYGVRAWQHERDQSEFQVKMFSSSLPDMPDNAHLIFIALAPVLLAVVLYLVLIRWTAKVTLPKRGLYVQQTFAMAEPPKELFILALGEGKGDRIFSVGVESSWRLSRLRRELKNGFAIFKDSYLDQIQIWVLERYIDVKHIPNPLNLDMNAPAYNGISLTRVGVAEAIVSHFREPFGAGEDAKIHLVVQFGTGFLLGKLVS